VDLLPLLRRLLSQIRELLGEELALARTEMGAKARSIGAGVVLGVVASIFGVAFLAVITAAAVLGLCTVMAPWAAACIVGAVYLIVAVACALAGRSMVLKSLPPAPILAMESLKENLAWAKALATSKQT
jgi:hypothetical protein